MKKTRHVRPHYQICDSEPWQARLAFSVGLGDLLSLQVNYFQALGQRLTDLGK